MKILQLYYKMPFPMNDGGAYAIYHSSLAMLGQHMEVRILAMDLLKGQEANRPLPPHFAAQTGFESVPVDNRIKWWPALANLFGSSSYFVQRFYSVQYAKRLEAILREQTFDIVQLEHLYLGLYLDVIRRHSKARVVLRAQNVEHKLWYDHLAGVKNPFRKAFLSVATRRLAVFEKQILASVDGIMAISPNDADCFRSYAGYAAITAIPVGMDTTRFAKVDDEKQYRNFPVLFHLGSMDWKPNIEGLRWFISKCWPLLKKAHPGVRLVIAGKNMPAWFMRQAGENLEVYGRVEDAVAFQEDKAILIVPLLAGSGIRIKILEAMAMGKAVVSTRVGAKGLLCEHEKNILLADAPQEFAEQISRCLASESLCRKLGKNAQQLVAEEYELKRTGARMLAFYKRLF